MAESGRDEALRAVEAGLQQLIGRVRRQIAESAERVSPGLTPLAFKVFVVIARRGPVASWALTEELAMDKSLVSRAVAQLEQLGLIARAPDPADGRVSLLSASPEGRSRLTSIRRPGDDPLATATTAWDLDQLRNLAVLLHALGQGGAPVDYDDLVATLRLSEAVTPA